VILVLSSGTVVAVVGYMGENCKSLLASIRIFGGKLLRNWIYRGLYYKLCDGGNSENMFCDWTDWGEGYTYLVSALMMF
jgi:hypothetical protein